MRHYLFVARFTVVIPDELNRWLMRQATLNHRSKNQQIEHILTMARSIPAFNLEQRFTLDSPVICHNGKHNFRSDNPTTDDFCNCRMCQFGEVSR